MICPKCNHSSPEGGQNCSICGTPLQSFSAKNINQNQLIPEKNNSKVILIVVIAIILILLATGVIGFFVFSKSRNSIPEINTTEELESTTTDTTNNLAETNESNSCDEIERDLLEKYKQDYDSCFAQANIDNSECQKTGNLGDTYKEYLNIIIILDSSGSMAENISGGKKMDIAKKVLNSFIETLPERAWVGLMAYGHKGSNVASGKAVSCAGIEMVHPLSELNKPQLKQAVNSFQPTGYTPIAGSLEKAKEIIANKDPEKTTNIIYLISDGIETCDGDPVAIAKELNSLNVQTLVNIVGFGVDGSAQNQLQATAQAGGGEYYSANSAEEMEKVFNDRSKYLKDAREYRDCVQSNARENRDEIQKIARQVRDCIQEKARKERDAIQKEIRIKRDASEVDYNCFGIINSNTYNKWGSINSRAYNDWSAINSGAYSDWNSINSRAYSDWSAINSGAYSD